MGAGDEERVLAASMVFQQRLDPAAVRRYLASETDYLLIGYVGTTPAGFARAHLLPRLDGPRPKLMLYEIETAPEFRRRGVARALIEELKMIGSSVEARALFVITNETNVAASALYESTGATRPARDDVVYVYDDI